MARIMLHDPWRDFGSLQDKINRLFNDTMGSIRRDGDETLDSSKWAPLVDIRQDGNNFVFEADIPGFEKDKINIDVANNILTISGERVMDESISKDSYIRVERNYGSFHRAFSLPDTVDSEKIDASYNDGILKLTMPIKDEVKPKRIKIKSNK